MPKLARDPAPAAPAVREGTVSELPAAAAAKHPEAGRAVVAYMSGPAAAPAIGQPGFRSVKR